MLLWCRASVFNFLNDLNISCWTKLIFPLVTYSLSKWLRKELPNASSDRENIRWSSIFNIFSSFNFYMQLKKKRSVSEASGNWANNFLQRNWHSGSASIPFIKNFQVIMNEWSWLFISYVSIWELHKFFRKVVFLCAINFLNWGKRSFIYEVHF